MHCRRGDVPVCGDCLEVHEALWDAILPRTSIFRNTDIVTLHQTHPKLLRAYDSVMNWHPKRQPKGLVLYGDTGVGKTRCVWLLLRKLYDQGFRFVATTSTEFANDCSAAFFDGCGPEWVEHHVNCGILFIDDIDKAPLTERVSAEMFEVIDRLTSNGGKLILTTQIVGQEFRDRFKNVATGAPLVRRIREFCTPVPFLSKP